MSKHKCSKIHVVYVLITIFSYTGVSVFNIVSCMVL